MEKSKKLDRRRFIKNSFMSAFGGGIYINSVNRSSIVGNFFTKGESNQKKEGDSKIEYRKLGKIGYNASLLGFGAMITTDPSVLVKALDMGINYVDTARGYQRGNCEVWVGKVVKNRRKNLFLTTKQKPGNIIEGAEESLKALDTDYVDGLLGHGLSREEVLSENVMSSLEKLKKEGKTRYIGASVHSNEAEVINAMIDAKIYDLVTVRYNFRSGDDLKKAIERANKEGLAVVAMKPMGGGKGNVGQSMGNLNPFQSALKWVMNDKNITTTIPSITSFQQLQENFDTMGAKMTWNDRKILDKYARITDRLYCRTCGECLERCPENVNIPDIMRFLMYADGYGELELGKDSYKTLSISENASKCIDCEECVVECVNKLNVGQRMIRAHSILA